MSVHTALLVALSLINANLWHFQTCFKDQTQSIAVALLRKCQLFSTTNSPKNAAESLEYLGCPPIAVFF